MRAHHVIKRLHELTCELHSMKATILHFNWHFEKAGKENIKLSEGLEEVWDTLEGWAFIGALQIRSGESDLPPFTQKTTLDQWIVDLINIRHNELSQPQELLGQPQASFIPPPDLQEIQIWHYQHPYFYGDIRVRGYFYWGGLFAELDFWREWTNANLEAVEWAANSKTVRFIMKWRGAFQTIEILDIEWAENTFWIVVLRSEKPAHLSVVSATYLLNAQLMARDGGNSLVPIELQDGRLTMALDIERADTGTSQRPGSSSVTQDVMEQLGHHLIERALPGYVEVSERLEAALFTDIDRLEPHMRGDVDDEYWLTRLREVLGKLQAAREALTSDWNSLS